MFILYEIWWYSWLDWIAFIAVAFCATRLLGGRGLLLSIFLMTVILVTLDVDWIVDDMRNHPENGRDADFVFMVGVALHVVVFNFLLLPVSLVGWRLSKRCRGVKSP